MPLLRVPSLSLVFLLAALAGACSSGNNTPPADQTKTNASTVIDEGRQTFRFETFGDEAFWGDTLKLHQAIEGSAHGGVGAGVGPATALSVGLKVDSDVLPASLINDIKAGRVNLNDPAVTLQLLDMTAVVGVKGFSNGAGGLQRVGITCALCHSTVDDSVAPGIGKRLDGWPNRDLNVGAIVNLSPDLSAVATLLGVPETAVRTVLTSWGAGKFDAELFLDGKFQNPVTGTSSATLLPPAFGLRGVNLHTFTGWGSLTQWNAFVANLEMHGVGHYTDSRLDDAAKFPVAARNKMGHTAPAAGTKDQITDKLGALEFYQLALDPPTPPAGSFDATAAGRGKDVFEGAGKCATCHVAPLYTDAGWNMHSAAEIGIEDFQAKRSPDEKYRTTPLRGLFAHTKGGFYHDGRFATLNDVVAHYNTALALGLTAGQQTDLVEYLKSL
jgi:cytochrome c5